MRDLITLLEAKAVAPRDRIEIITTNWGPHDLEPVMSADTVRLHLGKLAHGYAQRYNSGEGDPAFNYNGTVLHNLFFSQFRPPRTRNEPNGPIGGLIKSRFGSWDDFKDQFTEVSLKLQGSGWVYLARDGRIVTIHNHHITDADGPVILMDYWEHATAEYDCDRTKYTEAMWRIMDWNALNARLMTPYRDQ